MLEIYYGDAKNKNRLCVGAAVQAAIRQKNVLFVRFLYEDAQGDKLLGDCTRGIVFIRSEIPVELGVLSDEKRLQRAREMREFFDKAVRMALTFKYEVLLLDRIFDVIDAGLLSASEVYEFLSDAPDRLEIICTGQSPEERFLRVADEAVMLTETQLLNEY